MCVIQLNEFIIMMYYWLDKSMVGDDVYDIFMYTKHQRIV